MKGLGTQASTYKVTIITNLSSEISNACSVEFLERVRSHSKKIIIISSYQDHVELVILCMAMCIVISANVSF